MRRALPRLTVYVDGFCPYCRLAGRLLKRLDLFGTLDVRSFRHDRSFERCQLTPDALEREMHVIVSTTSEHTVYGGYAAVTALVRHMPVLWPLLPVAWLAERTGYGDRVYRWLAARRVVVPDAQVCARVSCRTVHRGH